MLARQRPGTQTSQGRYRYYQNQHKTRQFTETDLIDIANDKTTEKKIENLGVRIFKSHLPKDARSITSSQAALVASKEP